MTASARGRHAPPKTDAEAKRGELKVTLKVILTSHILQIAKHELHRHTSIMPEPLALPSTPETEMRSPSKVNEFLNRDANKFPMEKTSTKTAHR